MKEINIVIKDLEMLRDGDWEPDEYSCNASIEMLDRLKFKIKKLYTEKDMIRFMQFIISQETLENTSGVSETTAKYYLNLFKAKHKKP